MKSFSRIIQSRSIHLFRYFIFIWFFHQSVATEGGVRTSKIIWKKVINIDKEVIKIEVPDHSEVADVIFTTLSPFNITRENRLKVMEAAIQDGVSYSRKDALVFYKNIVLNDTSSSFPMAIFDNGNEPVDEVYNIMMQHKVEVFFDLVSSNVLPLICELIPCRRMQPIIYTSAPVKVNEGIELHGVEILRGEEAIDAIDRYAIFYGLGHDIRSQLANSICREVKCTRNVPVVFKSNVDDGKGNIIGTVEFLEGEEVIDSVVRFLRKSKVEVDEIGFKNHFFRVACNHPRLKCTRNVSYLFDGDIIRKEDGSKLGRLTITEYDEVADAVYAFCLENNCGEDYMWGIIKNLCMNESIFCERQIPNVLSIPINDPDGSFVGKLEIRLHEEPADAVYRFFALHDLFDKKWELSSVIDQICSSQFGLNCHRRQAVKFYAENFVMGKINVGTIIIWEHEEVIDKLFEKRIEYNLTLLDQSKAFSSICTRKEIYCARSSPIIYKLEDITARDFERFGNETCSRKLFGWQYLTSTSDSWLGSKAAKAIQNEKVAEALDDPLFPLMFYFIGVSCIGSAIRFVPYLKKRTHFGYSIFLSLTLLLMLSLIQAILIEPKTQIDQAMHILEGKMPDLVIYENEEPADAVLRWGKLAAKSHHPVVREKIYWDVLGKVCDDIKHAKCLRKRAWEYIDAGMMTVNNQAYKIDFYNSQVDPEGMKKCKKKSNDGVDACIFKTAEAICASIYPHVFNCVMDISKHISSQVQVFNQRRFETKDAYIKLELEMDAPQKDIWLAMGRIVRKRGINISPFRRIDNGTAVYGPNDITTIQAYKAIDAYNKIKDKESREWNDKPCTPYFGGALCGKTDKDGNMIIEV